ncbi:MAG: hypothetical protein RIR10_1256, partial [Planctomycetota bacterium]
TSAYAMIRNGAIAQSDELLADVDAMIALFRPPSSESRAPLTRSDTPNEA